MTMPVPRYCAPAAIRIEQDAKLIVAECPHQLGVDEVRSEQAVVDLDILTVRGTRGPTPGGTKMAVPGSIGSIRVSLTW